MATVALDGMGGDHAPAGIVAGALDAAADGVRILICGDREQLAAELGIGRTPVREALKRLESDHLVVSYPRRGTFATTVDIT